MSTDPVAGMPVAAATKTEAAYQALRSWIESGRLAPNANLRIGPLAAELGMSPTPVREALRMLQSQGLIAHDPHRGMSVADYRNVRVEEVYELRGVIEPLAARLAAERATEEDLDRIRAVHRELDAAVRSNSPQALTEAVTLNARWHQAIFQAAGSTALVETMDRIYALTPLEAMWTSSRAPVSVKEHEQVLEALSARDAARAALLMQRHIERGGRRAVARLRAGKAQNPGWVER